jgi:hypothetical protein
MGFGAFQTGDSLSFEITDNGAAIAPVHQSNLPAGVQLTGGIFSFSSLAAADAFFSDNLLTFDALSGNNTIGVNLNLTAVNPLSFEADFLLGTDDPTYLPDSPDPVPEPNAAALFMTALLGWLGLNRYKRARSRCGIER